MSTHERNFSERDYKKIFKGRPAGNRGQPRDPIAPTGERWIIPKNHELIREIKTNMIDDQQKTTLRDAFIKAFWKIVVISGIGVDINWNNYDIVFITSEERSKTRGQTQPSNDLGCYKWGDFVRNYGGDRELDLTLTITPVVKKAPPLPPIDNEQLLVKQAAIIQLMNEASLFGDSYPEIDLVTNVVYLRHDAYYVFNTCLGVFDPYHDFGKNPPWRSGPIVENLNGAKRVMNKLMNKTDSLKDCVKQLLQTQYDKLKNEYSALGVGRGDVFGTGGILEKIWDHQSDIEQTMLNELMPLSNMDENTRALGLYKRAKDKLHELQSRKTDDDPLRMSHINAPTYPKYDAPTEMFDSTFNNSCKFIVASAIDGASCGACGNLNKLLRGCPMEIGNINITFMRLNSDDNQDQENYVNFCSYMTNEARDGVYFHLRITRKVTIAPQAGKIHTAYYKYKLMDSGNDTSKLTVVTVDSDLGCYRDPKTLAVNREFMKINHMLPSELGMNEPTFGENVYDYSQNKRNTINTFDWVKGVRKACCDFLFSLPTFLKNGGYINILSSDNVISPNIESPENFPVCVSSGDQPATALAHFILKNCIEKKDNKNVNEFLHEYFATNNVNLRYGNREGTCISAVKRPRTDEGAPKPKRPIKGGGNRPYIGSSWGRVPRFDAKIDTQFKKIKAFFEGCAQFKYPVILLICYNEVKTDSDTLDNFLKYTVRDLGHFEYEAKTGFVDDDDDEKLKEDIKRLVRTMPQEEKSPNAYEKIIKTYNAVRLQSDVLVDGDGASASGSVSGSVSDGDGGSGSGSASGSASSFTSVETQLRRLPDKLNGGSSTRNHRRTQYTNKHKRSASTKHSTIKHHKSYRKHNRTIKRRKSRRHR